MSLAKEQQCRYQGRKVQTLQGISETGPDAYILIVGPYNAGKLIVILDELYRALLVSDGKEDAMVTAPHYAVIWDNGKSMITIRMRKSHF